MITTQVDQSTLHGVLNRFRDLNLTLVGTLVALASLTSSFGQPLFGLFSDGLRRPWFAALGPVVAAVFMSAIGLARDYPTLVALLLLAGIGVAAFHPQAASLASEGAPRRGLAMSVFVTGGTLGFAVGPLLAVGVVGAFGLGRTWLAMLPGLAMSAFLVPAFLRAPAPHRAERPARAPLAALRAVARPLALLYVIVVCRSAVSYGFMIFLALHLSSHGASLTWAGTMVTLYLALGASGGFFGGWLAEALAEGMTADTLILRTMQRIPAPERPLEAHVRVAAGS